MQFDVTDTIAAIATAPSGAARGIVRISGSRVLRIAELCFTADRGFTADRAVATAQGSPPASGIATATRGAFRLAGIGRTLPGELYLWPTSRSYTRQCVAEFHTIGSPPLLQALLQTVCRHGARLAEPGEFTMRAFLAGRLDLTQAEAVLGVIDAHGQSQLQRALAQLAGGLAGPLQSIRTRLIALLAELEAGLDFVEEDIEFVSPEQIETALLAAADELQGVLDQLSDRGTTGELPRIVLVGPPNVGKSSLFNALLGQGGALVSDQSGTTRDYLTARWTPGDISCELVDTAGVDDAVDLSLGEVQACATGMSITQRQAADVRVVCIDGSRPLTSEQLRQLQTLNFGQPAEGPGDTATMVVLTRVDLAAAPAAREGSAGTIATSSKTGQGLGRLRDELARAIEALVDREDVGLRTTALRCGDSLRRTGAVIGQALSLVQQRQGDELVAAELRGALAELGKVVGEVYTDDILDRVFSQFCIGK